MSASDSHLPVRISPAIARAAALKCPACGRGKFFRSYLHQVENCSSCGEHFGKIHADDGPAWLTIIIVGHLVVPSALYAETVFRWPLLVSIAVWPLMALALTLAVLPRAKAVFIAAIWAMKAPGFE
jgi:uncharacterized protein (DUF983 family)